MTECPTGILIEFDEEVVEKKLILPDVRRFSVPSTPVIVSSITHSSEKGKFRGLTYTVNDGSDEDVSLLENETFDFDCGSPVRSNCHYDYEDDVFSLQLQPCHSLLHNKDDEPKLSTEELTELFNEAAQLASQLELQCVLEKSRSWESADDVNGEKRKILNYSIAEDKAVDETNYLDCQKQDVEFDTSAGESAGERVAENKALSDVTVHTVEETDPICRSYVLEDADVDMVKCINASGENLAENPNQSFNDCLQLPTLKPSVLLERTKLVDYSCDTPDVSPTCAEDLSLSRRRAICIRGLDDTQDHCTSRTPSPLCKNPLAIAFREDSKLSSMSPNSLDLDCKHEHGAEAQPFIQPEPFSESPQAACLKVLPEECKTPEMGHPSPSYAEFPSKMLPRIHSTPILQPRTTDLSRTVTKSSSVSNIRDLRMRTVSSSLSDVNQRNTSIASTISDDTSPVSSGSSTSSMPALKSALIKPKMLGLLRPGFSTKTSSSSSVSSMSSACSTDQKSRIAVIPEGSKSQPLQRKSYSSRADPIHRPGPSNKRIATEPSTAKVLPTTKPQLNRKVLPSQGVAKAPAPVKRVQSFRDSSTKSAPAPAAKVASKAPARITTQSKMPPPQSPVPSTTNVIGQRGRFLSDSSRNSSFGSVMPTSRVITSTPQQTPPKLSPVFSSTTPVRQSSRLSLAPTPRSEPLSRRRSVAPTMLREQPGQKPNSSQSLLRSSASPVNTQHVVLKPKSQQTSISNKENITKQKPK